MWVKFRVFEKQAGNPMMTDPISDMLTRLRNASMVSAATVEMPMSKMKFAIAKLLEREGFVGSVDSFSAGTRPMLRVALKYDEFGRPRMTHIKRISKPGLRVYQKNDELRQVRSGYGVSIVSTPNGLMTNREARKRHLGGEVICEVA